MKILVGFIGICTLLGCQTKSLTSSSAESGNIRTKHPEHFLLTDRLTAINQADRIFNILQPVYDKIPEKPGLKGDITRYQTDKYTYFFGVNEDWEYHLEIEDPKGITIYSYDDFSDSQVFNPTFFETDYPGDPTIILIEGAGCGESWGNSVLIENQGTFLPVGSIDVATRFTLDNFEICDNIAPFTKITRKPDKISFTFEIEEIVYFPLNEEVDRINLKSDQLSYQFKNGRLNPIR